MSPISVTTVSPQIRRLTLANPPVNLIDGATIRALHSAIDELIADDAVQVVVFDSGIDEFFYNHADLADIGVFVVPDDEQNPEWLTLTTKIASADFVSIAVIRGHTRGGGDEFTAALDLRYASVEKATFAQIEVGIGLVPGGGGTDRLARLLGRDRALEAILSSDDYDAATAERFGWVTRALPDAELDDFVDALAARIGSFDKTAVATAKRQIGRVTLPDYSALRTSYAELSHLIGQPGFQNRAAGFGGMVEQIGAGEIERNLGHWVGVANQQPS